MEKRTLGIGALILASVLALAGCDSGARRYPAVSNVKAVVTRDGKNVIVTWDAVEAIMADYGVVSQEQGKKTVWTEGHGSNEYTYAAADGEESENTDQDKWAYIFETEYEYIGDSDFLKPGDKVRFGVVTFHDLSDNYDLISPIAWSGYITVPARAAP